MHTENPFYLHIFTVEIFPSFQVTELKNKYKTEFHAIMQPQRTPTGYRIEPARLVE